MAARASVASKMASVHPRMLGRGQAMRARAGLRHINLHGVRRSFATVSIDAGINPKILSERIGHSDVGFTMRTYLQRSPGLDKDAAATVAGLIVGKRKAS
jgi:integrase